MIDFKQNIENGDIDISNGIIEIVEPTQQHKRDILISSQGDFKQSPTTGVGLVKYINSNDTSAIIRNVSRQMQRDGIKVKRVQYTNGELIINGEYENN